MAPRVAHLAALMGLIGAVVVSSASITPSASALPRVPTSQVPPWALVGLIADKCGDSLCLMRADGSGSRNLLRAAHPWPQWDPAFSPNGRMLAFRGYYGVGDGAYALYVVGTNGCALHRLTRSIAGNPSWSPDGKWIAFDTSGEGTITKVHPNGTGLTRIASAKGADYDSSPAWSPNGRTIAFVHYRRGRGEVWVVGADGSGPRLLHADARSSDETPAWSNDGTRIAFAARTGGRSSIDVMDANGTNVRALTKERSRAWNPVWLPRDAGIAFLASASAGKGSLYLMRPNGTNVHREALRETDQFTWANAVLPQQRC
jgi:Tol biopolymer transport system component